MGNYRKIVFALVFAGALAGLIIGLSPGLSVTSSNPAQSAPPSLHRVVPPEEAAPKKPRTPAPPIAGKTITLVDAILLAEKQGKGMAIKAERRDKPELSFKIELLGPDGERHRIELTGDGRPLLKKEDDSKKEEGKKKPEDK